MHIVNIINDEGAIEIHFRGVGHWNDFDLILGLLQQENDCEILSNREMIYVRKAELKWNDISFELIQDDMLGNFILSQKLENSQALEKLSINVLNSITEKLAELELNEKTKEQ